MSWLRIDDGFTKHPKFEGWPVKDRWAWLEVMEYCARYETRGRIPADLALLPRTTTTQLLAAAEAAGWCDRGDDGALWVHDWDEFNPPRFDEGELDSRVAEAVADYPEASANEIVRMVGGKRKPTLEAIRRFRAGSRTGSTESARHGSGNQEGTGSRAGERARPRPVPTTKLQRSSGDQRLSSKPPPDSADAPPAATAPSNGTHRPAVDVAIDFVKNVGAEIPASDLHANVRAALTDAQGHHCRADELDDDDWITLTELHHDLQEATT